MAELLIHAGHNEHRVAADLLAPRLYWGGGGAPISRLVVDALTARSQSEFGRAANDAGAPLLVDPMTLPLQYGAHPENSWMQLPYASVEPVQPEALRDLGRRRELVAATVEEQLHLGASMVIPPYFYAKGPHDPWFSLNLALLRDTAQYLAERHVGISMFPIFCGRAQEFTRAEAWSSGLETFVEMARAVGAEMMAVSLSPVGGQKSDKYAKVLNYFGALLRVRAMGMRVIAWQQGIFGAGLVAAGIDGYSTGMGKLEATKASDDARRRRRPPREKGGDGESSGGAYKGLYLDVLGHSVPFAAGETLFAHERLRTQLICEDEICCPSWSDTLERPREHAIRSRARQLSAVGEQPRASWRLTQIVSDAETALNVAKQANEVLDGSSHKFRVKTQQIESLRDVAAHLRQMNIGTATA